MKFVKFFRNHVIDLSLAIGSVILTAIFHWVGIFDFLELKTYEMFFDNIEYEGHHLVWRSNFDEKSKLMKIGVTYSQMNNPDYQEELAKALQEWWDAEARGEDMDELIRQQFEAGKDHPNKPTLVGFIPAPKNTQN